jgi:hypothetical protein
VASTIVVPRYPQHETPPQPPHQRGSHRLATGLPAVLLHLRAAVFLLRGGGGGCDEKWPLCVDGHDRCHSRGVAKVTMPHWRIVKRGLVTSPIGGLG